MPYGFDEKTPIGLSLLFTLQAAIKAGFSPAKSYDKYQNQEVGDIYPRESIRRSLGISRTEQHERRFSKDGKRYTLHAFSLEQSDVWESRPRLDDYNSLSDIHVKSNLIELRIPGG